MHLFPCRNVVSRLATALIFAGISSASAALVIYYPLDEVNGNTAMDAATTDGPQNAAGTTTSDWVPGAGILGGALRFSPIAQVDTDEALSFTSATPILSGVPFTISYWIQTTNTSNWTHSAVYFGDPTGSDRYFATGSSTTQFAQLVARNTTAVNTVSTIAVNDGAWHNIVAVYSATNSRSLYVDGRLSGTSTTTVNTPPLTRLAIGALMRSVPTDSYSGLMDEVGLFGESKTPAEAALLNAFPRYDPVTLSSDAFQNGFTVFNSQSGNVRTGNWLWSYRSGLPGTVGSTGFDGNNPYVVMDALGNGLAAVPVPEPSAVTLLSLVAAGAGTPRRRQRCPWASRRT